MLLKRSAPSPFENKRTSNFDKNRRIVTFYDSADSGSGNDEESFKFSKQYEKYDANKAAIFAKNSQETNEVLLFKGTSQIKMNNSSGDINNNLNSPHERSQTSARRIRRKSFREKIDLNNNDDLEAVSNNFVNEMSVYNRNKLKRRSKENRRESFDANRNKLVDTATNFDRPHINIEATDPLLVEFVTTSNIDFDISDINKNQFEELLNTKILPNPNDIVQTSESLDDTLTSRNRMINSSTFTISNRSIPEMDRFSEFFRLAKKQKDRNLSLVKTNDENYSVILLNVFLILLIIVLAIQIYLFYIDFFD